MSSSLTFQEALDSNSNTVMLHYLDLSELKDKEKKILSCSNYNIRSLILDFLINEDLYWNFDEVIDFLLDCGKYQNTKLSDIDEATLLHYFKDEKLKKYLFKHFIFITSNVSHKESLEKLYNSLEINEENKFLEFIQNVILYLKYDINVQEEYIKNVKSFSNKEEVCKFLEILGTNRIKQIIIDNIYNSGDKMTQKKEKPKYKFANLKTKKEIVDYLASCDASGIDEYFDAPRTTGSKYYNLSDEECAFVALKYNDRSGDNHYNLNNFDFNPLDLLVLSTNELGLDKTLQLFEDYDINLLDYYEYESNHRFENQLTFDEWLKLFAKLKIASIGEFESGNEDFVNILMGIVKNSDSISSISKILTFADSNMQYQFESCLDAWKKSQIKNTDKPKTIIQSSTYDNKFTEDYLKSLIREEMNHGKTMKQFSETTSKNDVQVKTEKKSPMDWIKERAEEGAYQGAAKTTVNAFSKAITLSIPDEKYSKMFEEFSNSEFGKSIMSLLIGAGIHFAPVDIIGENKQIQKIADKCAENGVGEATEMLANIAMNLIMPALKEGEKTLSKKPNLRVVHDSEKSDNQEEDEELIHEHLTKMKM